MSELENIENSQEVETIPTDNSTNENVENVEQSTGDNELAEQERIQRELKLREQREQEEREREEAEEQARLQAIQEHEEYLNSFPETTVFYRDLLVNGNVKSLGTVVRDPHIAEQWGFLDNHFDESELTYVGTPECGIWYLKGYEKPEPTEIEKMKAYAKMIESQVDIHLQELCDSKGYDDVKSCVGYFNSTDETFQREARAMTVYRDHLYRTCYNIMDQCEKGEIDYRTVTLEYILSLIDPIEW